MGCDLIITYMTAPDCPEPEWPHAFHHGIDEASDIAIADALCRSGQDEIVADELPESVHQEVYNGECAATWLDSSTAMTAARDHLRAAVDILFPGGRQARSATTITVHGQHQIVVGGSSWGDDPFDGFGPVCALAELDPFSALDTANRAYTATEQADGQP